MLYNELDKLVEDYNERYRNANDWVIQATTELELEEAKADKAQLVNDYSQALYDFLWDKLSQLTAKDCIAFDLVPYGVWQKFSSKYELILKKVLELHS
jgi:hypothetical protein